MRYPRTASAAASMIDQRNSDKLERSPGSYFKGRARELVLAASYFRDRLLPNAYGGTASAHYHNLCAASFATMMSAFETMWKSLFAGVINATDHYDEQIVASTRLKSVVTTEAVLAHRELHSSGSVVASALGVWQRSETINENFKAAYLVEPISSAEAPILDQLWQVRHVIAHGAGVVGPLDAYRLRHSLAAGQSVVIDKDYLGYAERELTRCAELAVRRIRDRVLGDFLESNSSGSWPEDSRVFTDLFLLGKIVSPRADLPEVTEEDYEADRRARKLR